MPKATPASKSVQLAIVNHPFLVKIHSKKKKRLFSDFKLIKIILHYFLVLEALKYHNFTLKTGDTS